MLKNKVTVLIVDGRGRGHVLAEKYRQNKLVGDILVVPGSDLLKLTVKDTKTFPGIKTTDTKQIYKICQENSVDYVDVAQDDALASGLVDYLSKRKFKVFGPTKKASEIEWNKAFSRNFMKKYKLPIPSYKICRSEKEGISFLRKQKNSKWFVKASGLAGGKGALFAKNNKEAIEKIKVMKNFEESGRTYLIEECLKGEEFSSFAIVSGKNFKIVGHAQDHKTLHDRDRGPNTGGMGCSGKPIVITKKIENQITEIFKKTVSGLIKEKRKYIGVLYLGGIIDKDGTIKIIEFNSRWGDPEAQIVIPNIKTDMLQIIENAITGKTQKISVTDKKYRVTVTIATKGYPGNYKDSIGKKIIGLDKIMKDKKIKIYGAETKIEDKNYYINGGRLFYVTSEGINVKEARRNAYKAINKLKSVGNKLHYRTDIGWRDLERFNSK